MIDTRPAGIDPEGLAITVDGRRLFVVNENEGVVTILDVETRRIAARVEVGVEPETAVVSPDGR